MSILAPLTETVEKTSPQHGSLKTFVDEPNVTIYANPTAMLENAQKRQGFYVIQLTMMISASKMERHSSSVCKELKTSLPWINILSSLIIVIPYSRSRKAWLVALVYCHFLYFPTYSFIVYEPNTCRVPKALTPNNKRRNVLHFSGNLIALGQNTTVPQCLAFNWRC